MSLSELYLKFVEADFNDNDNVLDDELVVAPEPAFGVVFRWQNILGLMCL